MSVVMILVEPKPIPGIAATQRQDAETGLYFAAFAVVLPLALVAGPRLADRLAARLSAGILSGLAALLVGGLAGAVLAARVVGDLAGGMESVLASVGLFSLVAGTVLARVLRGPREPQLLRLGRVVPQLWAGAAALTAAAGFTVADRSSISPLALVVGVVAIVAVVWLFGEARLPRLERRWGLLVDLGVAVLLMLAISDLVFVTPEDPNSSVLERYIHGFIQFHHDFLLGPANQVLGGRAMLVDTASQYGVGSILFLAGYFNAVPIGYGTFGFLDGLLTGLFFVAGYCLLRVAGCSRLLAAAALALGLVALVLNRTYPVGSLPQEGPLRFGWPLLLILLTVAGARWPRFERAARTGAVVVVGVSAIWALEAFALTAVTFFAMACASAYLRPAGERLRPLLRELLLAAGAGVVAHLLFAAATLAAAGELPDWGQYLAFLRAFLFGDLGNLTYDFSYWSPALGVGALYMASATALVLVFRRHPGLAGRDRAGALALVGTTAYGIVLFNYYVDRSGDHVVPYISLPALLIAGLWLGMVLRARDRLPRGLATGALAFALTIALLLTAVAWSSIAERFGHSALAHAVPGGKSTRGAIDRLWSFPPIDAGAPAAERMLERHLPGERRSLVLIKPNLATETLMRSGRSNRLPLADPWQDGFTKEQRLPGLREAVGRLRTGDRVLLDAGALGALGALRADPTLDPLEQVAPGAAVAPLQMYVLQQMQRRFDLEAVAKDDAGFVVAELQRR